jgi:hypothetical protein
MGVTAEDASRSVTVEAYDKDQVGQDDFIGRGEIGGIDAYTLSSGEGAPGITEPQEVVVDLIDGNQEKVGEIVLKVLFEAAAAVANAEAAPVEAPVEAPIEEAPAPTEEAPIVEEKAVAQILPGL